MPDITISETNTDRRYTIEDEENVIRLLSIPSCLNSNGRLTPVAFSLYHNNEDYVSISRLFYSSRDECIELGKKRSISSTQILLLSKYKEDFKAHAGISFKNENGDIYVNIKKGTPSPAWLIPLQQRLCLISKVEKIDLKK